MENVTVKEFALYHDERGYFSPFALDEKYVQSNISFNKKKHTFRGLHYQLGEFAQEKTVLVLKGSIIDFIYDIDENSPTYMQLFSYRLNAGKYIVVPRTCAHAFSTLEKNTIVQYFVDKPYSPENERIISAKSVGIDKRLRKVISEKDKNPSSYGKE